MKIILRGLGVATPPLYATQEEAYKFFITHFKSARWFRIAAIIRLKLGANS